MLQSKSLNHLIMNDFLQESPLKLHQTLDEQPFLQIQNFSFKMLLLSLYNSPSTMR